MAAEADWLCNAGYRLRTSARTISRNGRWPRGGVLAEQNDGWIEEHGYLHARGIQPFLSPPDHVVI